MNPAPASRADYLRFRQDRLDAAPGDVARVRTIAATDAYRAGDPEAVAAYYRIHYRAALRHPEDVKRVIAGFIQDTSPSGRG